MGSIKSVRLVSYKSSFGLAPMATDEVEQRLTISSSGKVWFSARNYEQSVSEKGICRSSRLDIGPWKAEYLLRLLGGLGEIPLAEDCGHYELGLRFSDGDTKRIIGPMTGDAEVSMYEAKPFSLTKLLRRYVPVYALWGFDDALSPNYEGKKEIFLFAQRWETFFAEKRLVHEFEEDFGEECQALGFQMDCRREFSRLYPNCSDPGKKDLVKTIHLIQDIDLLGSAAFSQWRYITHWAYSAELDSDTCEWFKVVLGQMKTLTRRNT